MWSAKTGVIRGDAVPLPEGSWVQFRFDQTQGGAGAEWVASDLESAESPADVSIDTEYDGSRSGVNIRCAAVAGECSLLRDNLVYSCSVFRRDHGNERHNLVGSSRPRDAAERVPEECSRRGTSRIAVVPAGSSLGDVQRESAERCFEQRRVVGRVGRRGVYEQREIIGRRSLARYQLDSWSRRRCSWCRTLVSAAVDHFWSRGNGVAFQERRGTRATLDAEQREVRKDLRHAVGSGRRSSVAASRRSCRSRWFARTNIAPWSWRSRGITWRPFCETRKVIGVSCSPTIGFSCIEEEF